MKSKFLISSLVLSFMVTSSCGMVDSYLVKDKYQLKDTWGTDGNWGKMAKKTEVKSAAHEEHKDVAHEEPVKEVKHEEPVNEVKHEETQQESKEVSEKTVEEQSNSEPKTAATYNNDKYGYSVIPASNWQQMDTFGPIGAYYVKETEGAYLNFSVGAIRNLKDSDLNPKFKQLYLKRLAESFPNLEVISTKDENVKGQKAWTINYYFEKNGKKIQQKQVFIPHKENTLVMNWTASEEGFFKGGEDFNEISKNLVLK